MLIVYIVEIPINFFYFPIKIIPLVMHEGLSLFKTPRYGILSAISIDSACFPRSRRGRRHDEYRHEKEEIE